MALTLIEGPAKDYPQAIELLGNATAYNFAERPYGLYYLGVAQRELAQQILAMSPAERTARASSQPEMLLRSAAIHFGTAADGFPKALPSTRPAGEKGLPELVEWSIRARCDQADALIRIKRYADAIAAMTPLVNDPQLEGSRFHNLAHYYHGYACFAGKNYVAAGKSLALLSPFNQHDFGPHAHYLLARTHHLAGEQPEALASYQGVVESWLSRRRLNQDALKAATRPEEKAALEAALKQPLPQYVARAMFYWGVLLCELGRFDDAMPRFTGCYEDFAGSPLAVEAKVRAGICMVQTRKWPEAAKLLATVPEDSPLADQALRWLAKAQVLDADPTSFDIDNGTPPGVRMRDRARRAAVFPASLGVPIENFRKAADRAKAVESTDPDAHLRRAYTLMELGDTLRMASQYKEAAAAYATLAQAAVSPVFTEQALARQIVSLQLAGQYAESDQAFRRFAANYPNSTLLGNLFLRHAENGLLAVAQGTRKPAAYADAIERFQDVIKKYPDTEQAMIARQGIAMAYYEMGQFDQAIKLIEAIPEGLRTGELAPAAYLLADCYLRTLPAKADDALAAGRLIERLEKIQAMLTAFAVTREGKPSGVNAQIKLGYVHQRWGELLSDPMEKRKQFANARRIYAEIVQQFPNHPLYPVAVFEIGKMAAQAGAAGVAVIELGKFQAEPLKSTPLAPLALVHLGDAMRVRGKPDEAATFLTNLRTEYEAAMLKDALRAEYVPVMRYSQALALKEAGKIAPARDAFQALARDYPNGAAAAELPWRLAQCQRDNALAGINSARQALSAASGSDAVANARAAMEKAIVYLREVTDSLTKQAVAQLAKTPDSDVPLLMHYDAAWCWRTVAEYELDAARRKLAQEAAARLQEAAARDRTQRWLRAARNNELPLTEIPIQPAEQQARACYKAIIDASPASRIANDSRFELAEYHVIRDEYDPAIALMKEALDQDSPPEMMQRMRLRLTWLYLAKGDSKSALSCVAPILQDVNSYYLSYARAAAGEALFRQGDWKGAIEALQPMLNHTTRQGLVGVSDRAMLRIAHAYAQLGQWQESKAAAETLIARFGLSALIPEAKYALGLACQNLKDYENAAAAYAEVGRKASGELAVKSLYQAGICRLAQNRPADAVEPLLTVAYGYAHPELTPASYCEAARAFVLLKQPQQAVPLLGRVIADYPNTNWAKLAREELAKIKG